MVQQITVFRYGHRTIRDERVTTHCCLVARALGAQKIIVHGEEDPILVQTVKGIQERFGGKFQLQFINDWKKPLKDLQKTGHMVVHLTMYGAELTKSTLGKLKKTKKIVVFIGSQKVPSEVYSLSDYNISITQQPHSEIAALAIFLNEMGIWKKKKFQKAKIKIVPSARGKKVIKIKNRQ